ncbi:MAG: hypothetical protein CR988_00710 [Treponema sp.]|nr:MAG: hypothetical protein CR988_00710 [Treponema sp.]
MNKSVLRCFIVLAFLGFSALAFASKPDSVDSLTGVNRVAALNCLEKASVAYEKRQWKTALFQAQLGGVYDATLADFAYIEALCYKELNYPSAEQLERVEFACADGMNWRLYDRNNALLLCATIYANTHRYKEALNIASRLPFVTADIDYIKATSFYGLKKWADARRVISESLDKWSFDARFPKLFLMAEKSKTVGNVNLNLAMKILSRLYIWEEEDPSFFVFSAPFETDEAEIKRRLKIYREMYRPFTKSYNPKDLFVRSYALVLSLKYGIIDEKTAVNEFFNMKSICKDPNTGKSLKVKALYADHLYELTKIIGLYESRTIISEKLAKYSDCIFYDSESDGVLNSIVFFKDGRPKIASFDSNQDGYSDYIIDCNFGIPVQVLSKKNGVKVKYDDYPTVKSVNFENKLYVMRPLDLEWAPIELKTIFFDISEKKDYSNFFTLMLKPNISSLTTGELLYSASYIESKNPLYTAGADRVYLNKGIPISAETVLDGKIQALANFKNGFIALKNIDRDMDGFFETQEVYSKKGELETISIDLNKNKLYEYTEKYEHDGTVKKTWDSNEDSHWEIRYTEYPNGTAQTEWLHPKTLKPVTVNYASQIPQSVTYMNNTSEIIKEDDLPFFWLAQIPSNSELFAKEIMKVFNQTNIPVVSYNVRINGINIFATRSGGFIFADILEN